MLNKIIYFIKEFRRREIAASQKQGFVVIFLLSVFALLISRIMVIVISMISHFENIYFDIIIMSIFYVIILYRGLELLE